MPRGDLSAMGDIEYAELHQIARAEFRIDGQVEQCQIAGLVPHLQSNPDRPDVA